MWSVFVGNCHYVRRLDGPNTVYTGCPWQNFLVRRLIDGRTPSQDAMLEQVRVELPPWLRQMRLLRAGDRDIV